MALTQTQLHRAKIIAGMRINNYLGQSDYGNGHFPNLFRGQFPDYVVKKELRIMAEQRRPKKKNSLTLNN